MRNPEIYAMINISHIKNQEMYTKNTHKTGLPNKDEPSETISRNAY